MQFELKMKNDKRANSSQRFGAGLFFSGGGTVIMPPEALAFLKGSWKTCPPDIDRFAALLENSTLKISEFRKAITSKAGTTEAALKSFHENRLERVISSAVKRAAGRAEELSK